MKGQEICYFGLYKGPKGLTDVFLGSDWVDKTGFVIYLHVKNVHLQQFEGMQSSKLISESGTIC